MEESKRRVFIGAGAGMIGLLLLAFVVGLFVVYTGAYNVAATEDHSPFFRWAFTTTMHNSIEGRAAEVDAPARFDDAMVAAGAREYQAMCQHCHGGPGVQQADWAKGMLPQPPHLIDEASEWAPNEIFWIVKHGIKTTGMPAFGPTHDDETLWNIAAFVEQLPGMTEEQYTAIEADHSGGHTH